METTVDHDESIVERLRRDPEFAQALFQRALCLIVEGEPETARIMLRNLINATVGFEKLARQLDKHPKTLHRMMSPRGNPTMDNLSGILQAVQQALSPPLPPRRSKRTAA